MALKKGKRDQGNLKCRTHHAEADARDGTATVVDETEQSSTGRNARAATTREERIARDREVRVVIIPRAIRGRTIS